jgi:glycosyltransferase involved in cell wall biosynthesis
MVAVMRQLYFLLPGTGGKFACGGLWAELKTIQIAQQLVAAEVVTYRQEEPNHLFLDNLLQRKQLDDAIFVVSWGFDVAKLLPRLQNYNVLYHAHSAGYRLQIPASVPIITVSRNTMGYWGQLAPHSLIYYLPNQIADEFCDRHLPRDIDVLIQARKSSTYLMEQLIPALKRQCKVHVVDSYVEDLSALFNRAKIYLYDSAEYWAMQSVSEGFGLQPMEAMACGCQVFASVNGGLSDYLDPGFNCHKIAGYSKEYDVERILKVMRSDQPSSPPEEFLAEYRMDNILYRLRIILAEINEFFDHRAKNPNSIPDLTRSRITQLKLQRIIGKLKDRITGN